MKVGLIARGEDRGLGIQTWEAARHLAFDRVMLLDLSALQSQFPLHVERYPGALLVPFDGTGLPEGVVRDWLAGLDAVFTCETAYDWRLPSWCAEAGARLVCQVNPEFMRPATAELPVTWWNPTTWRMAHLPAGAVHVPVPVALDRFPVPGARVPGAPLRVLHVGGHAAMADRNGTTLLAVALQAVREPLDVHVISQDERLARFNPTMGEHGQVTVSMITGGVADYWRLYDGADVLALPRRYGGLCLPAQEAMAASLAVVMPDCEPQRTVWPPVHLTPAHPGRPVNTPAGRIALTNTDPAGLARTLDRLAADPDLVARLQLRSRAWACEHSWDELAARYWAEFSTACG